MIRAKPAPTLSASFELTPLIDIIFIVIVFLLLTANSQLFSVAVDIPVSDSKAQIATISEQTVTISLQSTPPFWGIDDHRYRDWQDVKPALIALITAAGSDIKFNVATDKNAPVEPLIKLLSLLSEQGITNTHILMEAQP